MSKDYYKTLGVDKSASKDDIKKAFRKLAHEHHPDKNSGNADKFKEASEAYSVLSDDEKRRQYDTFGSAGPGSGFGGGGSGSYGYGGAGGAGFDGFDFSNFSGGFGGFGGGDSVEFNMGDIFGDIFGGGRRGGGSRKKQGSNIQVNITITLKDAVFGVNKDIKYSRDAECKTCSGTGAKNGTEKTTCTVCNGSGQIEEIKRSIFGSVRSSRVCDKCHGKGSIPKEKCSDCRGTGVKHKHEEITITIPAGIESGESLRVTGMGEAIEGGSTGDLYIKITVEKHSHIKRDGANLYMDLSIRPTMALLGGIANIETLDGAIELTIPEGISHGEMLRIKGKGVGSERGKRGDFIVIIKIEVPKKISKNARKLLEDLQKEGL